MKPLVIFLAGIADDMRIKIKAIQHNTRPVLSTTGSSNVMHNLETDEFEKLGLILDATPTSTLEFPRRPQLIFNEIVQPDTHGVALGKAMKLFAQFDSQIGIINHPKYMAKTTRDQIYQHLHDIPNLIAPETLRVKVCSPHDILTAFQNSSLQYPFIIRECGLHNGDKMFVIKQESDIFELYALPFDGREFYLIQFYDYQVKGVYRKFRLFVIDGKAYIFHARHHHHWKIHHTSCYEFLKQNPEYLDQEISLLKNFDTEIRPQIEPMITAMHQRLQLDHLGMDCAITPEGQLLIFEANASMNCLVMPEKTDRYLEVMAKINQALVEMIRSRIAKNLVKKS